MSGKKKILQVQINPHFFYNTLNGMLALNRMGEKKKLEKSIMNLAELCRYSSIGGEDTAAIEDECMIQKQYLELEKLKYDDRIEYEISVEDACLYRRIPKLLLQPILENSVVHGLGEQPVLNIAVHVSSVEAEDGNMTKIVIRDDGAGFDVENMWTAKAHEGIDTVKRRAEEFDTKAVFCCTSKPGEGTETVLMFREDAGAYS